uniref:Uncharacterized protein n=1 Tax=Psilocybe cubensis TaxID=181762 RepID=A0A8H7Y657_PSICU
MTSNTISTIESFETAIRTLEQHVLKGLEQGDIAEVMATYIDLAKSIANEARKPMFKEIKEKPTNQFLFDFLLAYGKARHQGQHRSANFLTSMKDLAHRAQQTIRPAVLEGTPAFYSSQDLNLTKKLANDQQNVNLNHHIRHSAREQRRRSANENHRQVKGKRRLASTPQRHKIEGNVEDHLLTEASPLDRPSKRRRIQPVLSSQVPKSFREIEDSSGSDGEDYMPSDVSVQSNEDKEISTAKPNLHSQRITRQKSRGISSQPANGAGARSKKKDDRAPPKATQLVHVDRCSMCVKHGRNCRVTFTTDSCYYCGKHRRRCEGRGQALERCSVEDNESIATSVAEERHDKRPYGFIVNTDGKDAPKSVPHQDAGTGGKRHAKEKILPTPAPKPSTSNEKKRTQEPATSDKVPTAKRDQTKILHNIEQILNSWTEWLGDDVAQANGIRPTPSLPSRPAYIRNWEEDIEHEEPAENETIEERMDRLERRMAIMTKAMKKFDEQFVKNDHGFDYMAGKFAFFTAAIQVLEDQFSIVNHYHDAVLKKLTGLDAQVQIHGLELYGPQDSDSDAEKKTDNTLNNRPRPQEQQNTGQNPQVTPVDPSNREPPTDIDKSYIPVHSAEKLIASQTYWIGGTEDEPIDLEQIPSQKGPCDHVSPNGTSSNADGSNHGLDGGETYTNRKDILRREADDVVKPGEVVKNGQAGDVEGGEGDNSAEDGEGREDRNCNECSEGAHVVESGDGDEAVGVGEDVDVGEAIVVNKNVAMIGEGVEVGEGSKAAGEGGAVKRRAKVIRWARAIRRPKVIRRARVTKVIRWARVIRRSRVMMLAVHL